MGLFDTKKCVICGKEAGLITGLFGNDLAGGGYLCGDCRKLCTPGDLRFSQMSVDDVKANMAVAAANRKKATSEFRETRKIKTGAYRDRNLLSVDENHGWFMCEADEDGWVLNLDDIYYYGLLFETSKLEEGQHFTIDTYSCPELPNCPEGIRIISVKLKILLADNELGVNELSLDLTPMFSPGENDIRGAYACMHDFVEVMKAYRTAKKK
ncbi:MAG: hypothetical protein IKS32_03090 [Solobacterium sp.]|nr:hypothetical protein [Solobacterium sp.]